MKNNLAFETQGFLAGVATSGYQSEGGFNGPGEPKNNWARHESIGRVARSGKAVDFWNRYREDYALCRGMGLNAFRLSIEWARVQPSLSSTATHAPEFDENAMDAYAERIAACREAGLEPVITLHHFTHPAWLGLDAWLDDQTPEAFEKFVRATVLRVNDCLTEKYKQAPLKWYVTLNEPNMLVLNTYLGRHFPGGLHAGIAVGVRAYNRLLAAHVRAYNAIHDIYEARGWPSPQVTINTFCSDVYWSENMLLDLLCMRENAIDPSNLGDYFSSRAADLRRALAAANLSYRSDFFAWLGRGIRKIVDFFASRAATPEGFEFFIREAEQSKRERMFDFLGLDYYDPFFGHVFRPPAFSDLEFPSGSLQAHLMDGLSSKWWDWHILPEGLHTYCVYYAKAFPGRAILIAENGMAQRCKADNKICGPRRDRVLRSDFLSAHLREIRRILNDGIPILGYLHWSLTDNYEWGSFTPRFGLFRIDYMHNLTRHVEDHLGDKPSLTYSRLLRELGLLSPENVEFLAS